MSSSHGEARALNRIPASRRSSSCSSAGGPHQGARVSPAGGGGTGPHCAQARRPAVTVPPQAGAAAAPARDGTLLWACRFVMGRLSLKTPV